MSDSTDHLPEVSAVNPFGPATTRATAMSAAAQSQQQREIAEVQAKLIMAQRFPRDQVAVTDQILNAFTRPRLAEQAQYAYARGGSDISGPSIRAAETIAQLWENLEFGFREVSRGIGSDGISYSEVEAFAWDVQKRTRRALTFQIRHWRDTKRGGYPVKDERDIYELMANNAQRRVRACILAIVPGDVVEAAMNQAEVTLRAKADVSPEAMAKLVEAFGQFEVTKDLIEKRIQRRLDSILPAQVIMLRKIYASLRDGMSTAPDWFEIEPPEPEVPAAVGDLNARIAAKAAKPAKAANGQAGSAERRPAAEKAERATFAEIADIVKKAKTADELELLQPMLEGLPDDQRAELQGEIDRRQHQISNQEGS